MADLQSKYQILATEYAKLKSHIPILKKAVVDEKASNVQLKDIVKEKEQALRKFEQEVDSLSFRNQQLTKRVLVLQEELQGAESKKRNKHKNSDPPLLDNFEASVIGEELQNKIQENERLHKQVYDTNEEYQIKTQELQNKLSRYERETNQHQEILTATVQKNKSHIDKLQEEKAMLEIKLQGFEQEVKDYRSRAEHAEVTLREVQEDLQTQLNITNKLIADKLPFVDTKHRYLNGLNLPTHDRKHQLQARELVSQAASLVSELTQGLSNFYTYSEQRSRIYPADGIQEPLSPINNQYCKYLHENAAYLRPLDQAFRFFLQSLKEDSLTTLETATDLQPFATKFKKFISYMNKLLPYQLLSFKEECAVSSCTKTLEAKNMDLYKSFQHLTYVCNKLQTYVSVLAAQSIKHCNHPPSNHSKFFVLLCKSVRDLNEAIKDVSKHYNSKVTLEHQLPTATQKLKTTDECIVSSLISLVTCTGKFSAFLSGNQEFFNRSAGYRVRGSSMLQVAPMDGPKSNPVVVQFRQKASDYIFSITRSCPESVPHRVAVQNRKFLFSSAESKEGLSKQLQSFQNKLSKLEQEKEHWMLELQLLKIKYDNELQKSKHLEKEVTRVSNSGSIGSIQDNMDVSDPIPRPRSFVAAAVEAGVFGKVSTTSLSSTDAETREQLIKDHFSKRLNELTLQLQVADSKAVCFHAEVRALHKRLSLAEKSRDSAQGDAKGSSQTITQLKDELQTTIRSYDGQLSMMSEHLASMNEKLAQQKDEIDDQRLQLAQTNVKGQKKSKK